ncbi:MAG TPA: hypothetical protein VGI30_05425, partial [Caulobacteraceae bacterium]
MKAISWLPPLTARGRASGAWALVVVLLAAITLSAPARADIVVNVDQGASQPLPIAIPAFTGPAAGARISQVIAADLARSELFRPLDPAGFQE